MTTTPTYPNLLAAGTTISGSTAPFELFAGEREVTTQSGTVGATAIEQFRVIALDATGVVVPFAPAGTAPTNKAVGIAAQPAAAGDVCAYYSSGFFNSDVLVWPSATNTLSLRKLAFAGTSISVGLLLGAQFPA